MRKLITSTLVPNWYLVYRPREEALVVILGLEVAPTPNERTSISSLNTRKIPCILKRKNYNVALKQNLTQTV